MASLRLPSSIKAAQLKHAAFLMGIPTAGTKSEMESLILSRLRAPSLLPKPTRVVSIDMGIKNLGLCALEVPKIDDRNSLDRKQKSRLKIVDWKKLDVLASMPATHVTTPAEKAESKESQVSKTTRRQKSTKTSPSGPAAFTPSNLSTTALSLARNILETYNPTHVLIERQRFRSGGAAAVQEWTLRVNMLESMIWACLTTLRASSKQHDGLTLHEISPARVAKFWCLGGGTTVPNDLLVGQGWKEDLSVGTKGATKVGKNDKIAVVRSWLGRGGTSNVDLEFSDDAAAAAQSFLSQTKRGRGTTQTNGKLDDLADCLLQGAAWVRWAENRQRILRLLDS